MGLLGRVFPELDDMKGVEQNGYHHLDVYGHSLAAVACLEEVLAAPAAYFGEMAAEVVRYARQPPKAVLLKLAALFHDAGKPQVQERRSRPGALHLLLTTKKWGWRFSAGWPQGCGAVRRRSRR